MLGDFPSNRSFLGFILGDFPSNRSFLGFILGGFSLKSIIFRVYFGVFSLKSIIFRVFLGGISRKSIIFRALISGILVKKSPIWGFLFGSILGDFPSPPNRALFGAVSPILIIFGVFRSNGAFFVVRSLGFITFRASF